MDVMSKVKLIEININAAKDLVRILSTTEKQHCIGCEGDFHLETCPGKECSQLRNYLTQRINNPNKRYGI
jgi:hypothetical protein